MKLRRTRPRHRADVFNRGRLTASVASIAVGALVIGTGVTSSAASWVDREHVRGDAANTLDCTVPAGAFDTNAWGRVLSLGLLETSLDPLVATDGVTVQNTAPATTSTGTSAAYTPEYLGDDAWEADLELDALGVIPIGVGLELPLDTGTGVYSQFGRASTDGTMIGASGAVTSQAGGLASLTEPTSNPPRLGDLQLSGLVNSLLPGLGLGTFVGDVITDATLSIGAVGSLAALDGCDALWRGGDIADYVDRDYLVADLDLLVKSPLVADVGTALSQTIDSLESTINGVLALTADDTLGKIVNATDALLGGIAGLSLLGGQPTTIEVAGTVDLQPVRALLDEDITDGVVTINLSEGSVRADLASLLGEAYEDSSGLNGRAPNTSVLTPEVINALLARASALLSNFITNTIQQRVLETVYDVDLEIHLVANVAISIFGLLDIPVAKALIDIDLPVGGLLGQPGYDAPSAGADLDLLGLGGRDLLSGLLSRLVEGVVNTLLPGVVELVQPALSLLVETTIPGVVAAAVGALVPQLVSALTQVFDILALVVKVTLNAQADQPATPFAMGPPIPGAHPGRYFVSALHVQAVGAESALLDLYLASSSVGPMQPR